MWKKEKNKWRFVLTTFIGILRFIIRYDNLRHFTHWFLSVFSETFLVLMNGHGASPSKRRTKDIELGNVPSKLWNA